MVNLAEHRTMHECMYWWTVIHFRGRQSNSIYQPTSASKFQASVEYAGHKTQWKNNPSDPTYVGFMWQKLTYYRYADVGKYFTYSDLGNDKSCTTESAHQIKI